MAYIEITPDDIKTYLAHSQLSILTTNPRLNEEHSDHLSEIIQDVVNSVHLKLNPKILSENDSEELSQEIHSGLKIHICALVIESLQSRIQNFDLSQDQIRNAENARKFIDFLAKNYETNQKSHNIQTIKFRKNSRIDWKDLRGL